MKTLPSPRKKKAPDESRKAFFFACGVYAPLLALLTTLPTENFAGAGTQATVALTFAQLTGGGPVAPAGDRSVSDAEPVSEPVAQPAEETAPEPISEPEPVPEPEPEPEPVPVPAPKAAPERKPEPKPEPKPVPEARKKVKPQPAAKKPTKKEAPKTVVKKATSDKPSEIQPDATSSGAREGATSPAPSNVARTGGATASQQGGIATMVYGEVHDPFLAEVKRSVESVLEYPRKARAMRMEGTAVVQFVIDASGRLESLELHKSAGKPLLDKMALKAVRRAQGLWSKPQKTVRLRFPIRFELRG